MTAMFPLDHFPHWPKDVIKTFKPLTTHKLIANGGYNRETGEKHITKPGS
jgi:N-ethylmaleimide reductase